MIRSVVFRRWLRHKHARFDFAPGLNIITGSSDTGKSCLVRGILWCLMNITPKSDIRTWETNGSVSVACAFDDVRVKRIKGERCNELWIDDEKFRAIGARIPEQAEPIISFSDANYQGQHTMPFMLMCKNGEITKLINGLLDLEQIDKAAVLCRKRQRNLKSEIQRLETSIQHREETYMRQDVDGIRNLVTEIEGLYDKRKHLSRQISIVQNPPQLPTFDAEAEYDKYRAALNKFQSLEQILDTVEELEQDLNELKELEDEISRLSTTCPTCGQKVGRSILR